MIRRLAAASIVVLAVAIGAGVGRIATASNTVSAGAAGQGSSATSAYTVSNVAYALDASSPTNIDSVSFLISPSDPRVVKAQLVSGTWYSRTNTSGSVTCPTTSPQATVASANGSTLVVVASQ